MKCPTCSGHEEPPIPWEVRHNHTNRLENQEQPSLPLSAWRWLLLPAPAWQVTFYHTEVREQGTGLWAPLCSVLAAHGTCISATGTQRLAFCPFLMHRFTEFTQFQPCAFPQLLPLTYIRLCNIWNPSAYWRISSRSPSLPSSSHILQCEAQWRCCERNSVYFS